MNKSKIEEFHISFVQNLVFIGFITLVSMVSARYLVRYSLLHYQNTPVYTSDDSQISSK